MTISYRARPDLNLAIIEYVGNINDDEVVAFYKELYEIDTFDPSMNQLFDLRKTDSTLRRTETLQSCAEFVREAFAKVTTYPKVAVIAPKALTFGLARMFEAFAAKIPWEFEVFHSIDTALAWLGLPEDLLKDYE